MSAWLKSMLGTKPSTGGSETVRRFGAADSPLSRDSVQVQDDAWLVERRDPGTVRLFEVARPDVEECMLSYRVMMRSEDLDGRAFLEMWCRLPGRGEFFSRGLNQTISGTTDWASFEVPFRLKKGQRPDLIKLNLVVEGGGRVWLKDIELLKAPL